MEQDALLNTKQNESNEDDDKHAFCQIQTKHLTDKEKVLLTKWNETTIFYPRNVLLIQAFEEQVLKNPKSDAVTYAEQKLSYEELNKKANQLAHYLRAQGIGPESLVAISMERSLEMVIGLLGILKSGGAYIPLDTSYPKERLHFILQDTKAGVLITQDKLKEKYQGYKGKIISLESDRDKILKESEGNPVCLNKSNDLAYVIYTSGSTGQPKGVMVQHYSILNFSHHFKLLFHPSQRVSLWTNINFDVSLFEMWQSFLNGACLFIPDDATRIEPISFFNFIINYQIDTAYLPPYMLDDLSTFLDKNPQKIMLANLLVGVEPIRESLLIELQRKIPNLKVINGYGPTETTVCATYYPISSERNINSRMAPIGRPIANTQIYILDEHMEPVSIEQKGEIYIGGEGVARGYLNRPELAKEKFIKNPFSKAPGARLYKTGDLGRYLSDGNIEFLGRVDNQVKIRGYRIELGEIESMLLSHPSIRETAVIAREDILNNKNLVAYVVFKEEKIEGRELRTYLEGKLPEHMIPVAYVVLENLPWTPNGKLDRKNLPMPERQSLCVVGYVPPRTHCEKEITQICIKLLAIKEVGCKDNLLMLGFNSLLFMQLKARLRNKMGVELSFDNIWKDPTIEGIARHIEPFINAVQRDNKKIHIIPKLSYSDPIPLTFQQEQIWWFEQFSPECRAYQAQFTLHIRGKLRKSWLERSLTEVVKRQAIFRTAFIERDNKIQQIIHEPFKVQLTEIDISHLSSTLKNEEIKRLLRNNFQEKINISIPPLVRWHLYRLEEDYWIFAHMEHHIIHDGWTVNIFLRDLKAFYELCSKKRPKFLLPPLSFQYADYAIWQRQVAGAQAFQEQTTYWVKQLSKIEAPLTLIPDKPRPKIQTFEGKCLSLILNKEVMLLLQQFKQDHSTTLFTLLYTIFGLLLFRYTEQKRFVLATGAANRDLEETELLCGMFVNPLPICLNFDNDLTFLQLLESIHQSLGEANTYSGAPFQEIVNQLGWDRDLSHNPVFQVCFAFHDSKIPSLKFEEMEATFQAEQNGTAKFDINITGIPSSEEFTLLWEYNTDLFAEQTISHMMNHYLNLLRACLKHPQEKINQISFLSNKECHQLLMELNQTIEHYLSNKAVHQLFEEQVEKSPHSVAVIFEDEKLTYKELNEKANRLGRFLREKGVKPDTLVAIACKRSLEMIVGILGILKAGGAYVPLDPSHPSERLKYMLEDTKCTLLLTHTQTLDDLPETESEVVLLDDNIFNDYPATNISSITQPHHLAYIIYTSGSTGKPKGVMIEHRNLTHYINYCQKTYPISNGSSLLHSSVAFDMSITSIFLPLMVGNSIFILSEDSQIDALETTLRGDNNFGLVKLTPTHLKVLKNLLNPKSSLKQMKSLVIGGENLLDDGLKFWLENIPELSLFNEYGPTETTVGCCVFKYENSLILSSGSVPIGRPISNTQIYILDSSLNPVPIGVKGEIYIGGVGLARGYFNRPDMTAERFIPNPFIKEEDVTHEENALPKTQNSFLRLYRTGDLARYLPNGNIEFLGRVDDQIKIRGFRIEVGEIEFVLNTHGDVAQSVVIAREDKSRDKKLVAYVLPGEFTPSVTELRDFLLEKLPEYMIPTFFVYVDKIPLTSNGKIDRKALPSPDLSIRQANDEYVAPQTRFEKDLCAIWTEVLSLKKVGTHDNFFKLGGHSLLATQIVSRLRSQYSIKVSLKDFFENANIADLAQLLERNQKETKEEALFFDPISREKKFPLSFAQQRLWFIDRIPSRIPH